MEIYLVGGAVRDTLLDIEVKERDWVVVGATPQAMIELGYKQVGSDFPVFIHPDTKEEYALARTERKSGTGHKGFSFNTKTNVTLEEDLKRRDLTINAIAKTREGALIDPFDGQKDLKNKILRQVSDAFKEDPLRVLRVARFSAKLKHLDFSVDKKTMETMKDISVSGELESLPKERIWQETYKALKEKNPEEYFKVLIESEAIFKLEKPAKIDLELFKNIASKIPEPELRWASLAANSDCNLDGLNAAFGVPKKIQDLSRVFEKLIQFNTSHQSDVKSYEVLDLIEEVDALRRNKRFNKAIRILESGNGLVSSSQVSWEAISKELSVVKPSSLVLKGKEISEDLRQQRLKIIDGMLKKNG